MRAWSELNDRVDGYFGVTDEKLRQVAQTLVRSGMEWSEARRLMSDVYYVGYEEGYGDGYNERDTEGCCE